MPATAVPLHIFEPRYLALMDDLTGAELGTPLITPEMGVVGIERGHEVGGGEQRSRVGTLTRLVEAEKLPDGRWVAIFAGVGRFRVDEWLADDPYPLAMVTDLADADWDRADDAALAAVQELALEVLALAAAVGDIDAPGEVAWSSEPAQAAWQVCALAPIGALDRQQLLEAPGVAARLALLRQALEGAAEVFAFRLGDR
jgi:uncharacterized protein